MANEEYNALIKAAYMLKDLAESERSALHALELYKAHPKNIDHPTKVYLLLARVRMRADDLHGMVDILIESTSTCHDFQVEDFVLNQALQVLLK